MPDKPALRCRRIFSLPSVPILARRRCLRSSPERIGTRSSTGSETPRNPKPDPGASTSLSRCWPEVRPSTPRLHDHPSRRFHCSQNVPHRKQRRLSNCVVTSPGSGCPVHRRATHRGHAGRPLPPCGSERHCPYGWRRQTDLPISGKVATAHAGCGTFVVTLSGRFAASDQVEY